MEIRCLRSSSVLRSQTTLIIYGDDIVLSASVFVWKWSCLSRSENRLEFKLCNLISFINRSQLQAWINLSHIQMTNSKSKIFQNVLVDSNKNGRRLMQLPKYKKVQKKEKTAQLSCRLISQRQLTFSLEYNCDLNGPPQQGFFRVPSVAW